MTIKNNHWQDLKAEWQAATEANKKVKINLRVLFDPAMPQQPAGLEVCYHIDDQSFTRTFRGIPEGYDAISQSN